MTEVAPAPKLCITVGELQCRAGTMTGSRRPWTGDELIILHDLYPAEGAEAVHAALPHRPVCGIRQRGAKEGLRDPTVQAPSGLSLLIMGDALEHAMGLRAQGWGYTRIGRELGCGEQAVSNAIMIEECRRAGGEPAKRDASGGLMTRDVQRMRRLLLAGRRNVEIQREMAVSAGCVRAHRRRLEAERKAAKAGRVPPPGNGEAYSGRKLPPPLRKSVEALLLTGLGAALICERTGVSNTSVKRIRTKLVRRLRRRGEALPGCDIEGRRMRQVASRNFVPVEARERLRQRILSGEPVARAGRDLGIGRSTSYKIRDALRDELAAAGRQLAPPKREGLRTARYRAIEAAWLPERHAPRFKRLCHEVGLGEARRIINAEMRAERMKPLSFAEQMERVRQGANLTETFRASRTLPDVTLGGIASAAL